MRLLQPGVAYRIPWRRIFRAGGIEARHHPPMLRRSAYTGHLPHHERTYWSQLAPTLGGRCRLANRQFRCNTPDPRMRYQGRIVLECRAIVPPSRACMLRKSSPWDAKSEISSARVCDGSSLLTVSGLSCVCRSDPTSIRSLWGHILTALMPRSPTSLKC